MSLQYLKKEMRYKVAFLHVDKHQSFYFNTLGTKVSCKVILSLLMDIMKHSHSNQSNKFVTIIVSLLILGKNTKKLQLYCLEINTIIFFDKQATAKLLGLFTPIPKALCISCKKGA